MSTRISVPIFPLSGAILFPRAQLPLHIFEPRYRDMVKDAMEGPGRIAMIQPRHGDAQDVALFDVGCVGDIVGVEELDDGRFNIVLLGTDRFKLVTETASSATYRTAEVDINLFDDSDPDPLSLAERAAVEREARRLGDAMGLAVDWNAVGRLDDETLVNAIAQVAPFDPGAKQALLETIALDERCELLIQLMQFHRAAIAGTGEADLTIQ